MNERHRVRPRMRGRLSAMVAAVVLVISAATAVLASAPSTHPQRGVGSTRASFVDVYDYGTGTPFTWTTGPDFSAGTLAALDSSAVPGSLVLAAGGAPGDWWDSKWDYRRCDVVDNSSGVVGLSEFVVETTLDTQAEIAAGRMDANANSLRAIAADGSTELPIWVKGPIDDPATEIWVQVDSVGAGATTEYCLYWDSANKPSASDEAAVLTTSAPQPRFVLLGSGYAGGLPVDVTPILDRTDISNGTSTITGLRLGKTATLPAAENVEGTLISATAPIAARSTSGTAAVPAPLSFAGQSFAVPTERGLQTFVTYAPAAAANVTISEGGVTIAGPFTVPAGAVVTTLADVAATGAVITADADIVLVHETTTGTDAYAVPPADPGPWVGVRSATARIGLVGAASGSIVRSDGSTMAFSGAAGDVVVDASGTPSGGGAGDGLVVDANAAIAVIQQEDGSGSATSSFLPVGRLDVSHAVPTDAGYVSVVCPTAGETIVIDRPKGSSLSATCAGAAGGPGITVFGAVAAGSTVRSTSGGPVWVMYEDASTGDETNAFGSDVARQFGAAMPGLSVGVVEDASAGYVASGTWESGTVDTAVSGVFGTLAWNGSVPAGTSISFQVATTAAGNPNTFVGPDGTGATVFSALEDAFAFAHDGDRYLRVRATLATSDAAVTPVLDDVTVRYDLSTLDSVIGTVERITVTGSTTVSERRFVARIRTTLADQAGSLATLSLLSSSNVTNVEAATVLLGRPDSASVVIAGGAIGTTSGPAISFDDANPNSIAIDQLLYGPGTTELELLWRLDVDGLGSAFVERIFILEVAG